MKEYFVIGTIIGTHALKGELKVYSTTDFKEDRYQIGNKLYVKKDNEYIEVLVKTYRVHKQYDLLSFEGYNTINDVEKFNKCKLYVDNSQLKQLGDEEYYYYHQLIDCCVFSKDNKIGIVKNVVNYGASDILVIFDDKNKEIMIPFVDDFVKEVDIENKKIFINIIEGLLGEDGK